MNLAAREFAMRTIPLCLLMAMCLLSCLRDSYPRVPVENDTSIRFPKFFESKSVRVSAGEFLDLDGEMLRALMIAANDFLPPGGKNRPCEYRQEAQNYRVVRESNIIFVYIYENNEYCGYPSPSLDSGVRYAISTDGRILRRLFDGQPEDPSELIIDFDAGGWGPPSRPGISPEFDARWNRPDAGTWPGDGGPTLPQDPPPLPIPPVDGGSPGTP
jgi:hypothetical protein